MNSLGWSYKPAGVSFPKKAFKKGAYIYREDGHVQDVFRILKGRVKLCKQKKPDNRHIIFHIKQTFDFFGVVENVVRSDFRRCAAIALDKEVVVQIIPFSEFRKHVFSSYDNRLAFMEMLANDEDIIWSKVCSLNTKDVTQRVFKAINRLIIEKGRRTEKGIILHGISHIELAKYIGASRQSVTTAMNRFRREGKLDYNQKQIILKTN